MINHKGHIVRFRLVGQSPLSFNKYVSPDEFPKLEGENAQDWGMRIWQEKAHYDHEGQVKLPSMMLKNALVNAGKYRGEQVPGKGKKTFTKFIMAAVVLPDDLAVSIPGVGRANRDNLQYETVLSGNKDKKIPAKFPILNNWEADGYCWILDDTIKEEVFKRHLQTAGMFIGLGKFRIGEGGCYGRFGVEDFTWEEMNM